MHFFHLFPFLHSQLILWHCDVKNIDNATIPCILILDKSFSQILYIFPKACSSTAEAHIKLQKNTVYHRFGALEM